MVKYVDTSAFVKYYANEESEKGARLISGFVDDAKQGKEQLLSNIFLIGEVVSVFDKWFRLKLLSQKERDTVVRTFFADVKQLTDREGLILEPLNSLIITSCTELMLKHHLTINDAIHLYTALSNRDIIEQFVCADATLLNAAKAEGLSVRNPEKA